MSQGASQQPTSPLMKQYFDIKAHHPEDILMFRMGDFYEMMFEDAVVASDLLGIALTARGKGTAAEAPMCGVPFHAARSYIAKLVNAGKRVAICEQMEEASQAKGLVKRAVVEVISPGTALDEDCLEQKDPHYIATIVEDDHHIGVSLVDFSAGRFEACCFSGDRRTEQAADLLLTRRPVELILPQETTLPWLDPSFFQQICITYKPTWLFSSDHAAATLVRHFRVQSLASLGMTPQQADTRAAGGCLAALQETQAQSLSHLLELKQLNLSQHLVVDHQSVRNLELVKSLYDGRRGESLLGSIDWTMTAMGSRLLREWLLAPLMDLKRIAQRQHALSLFVAHTIERGEIRRCLKGMTDLQRQLNKMMLGKMSPRECRALADALQVGHVIGAHLARLSEDRFGFTLTLENALQAIATDIDRTLVAEPPHHTRQGGVIAEGVQEELDELRHLRRHSRDILTQMEAREREATGIPKLKIQFNKVFGYFIEVSKVQQDKVPPHYVRRQTLVNSERFITDELKHIEEKILGAEDRILQLEEELFQGLIASLQQQFPLLMTWADLVARIDVFSALAELAVARNYCRPQVHDGETIRIVDGRHPVVEALSSEPFIANDTYLNNHSERLKIITGPNMGGKSTYLRQVALIVLMAQMGSYVSASEAEIGLVDRIFTRVGASDHLARGQSTFMVEMMETSHILRNATPSSLIILDEIGRGTSTFDGLSIAWSVAEYIADPRKIGAKTLFATHYHEMTDLAKTEPGVGNLHITVKEWDQQILFLRRIAEGPADQSYGIHVGQLAGLPHEVIKRARRILSNLERNELDTMGTPRLAKKADEPPKEVQTSLIPEWDYPFLEELRQLQVDELSPKEALSLLYRWKEHL